jgi:hypothetical protein
MTALVAHVQAPEVPDFSVGGSFVFVAGGIGGCPDWQSELVAQVSKKYCGKTRVTLVNPRRMSKFETSGEFAKAQIEWEFHMLSKCTHVLFWFPQEALCPIALFELGVQLGSAKRILGETLLVGWHDQYPRSFDLQVQLSLALGSSSLVEKNSPRSLSGLVQHVCDALLLPAR